MVNDLIDERGVRTVFQQSPHQIGQQITMGSNRCINPAAGHFGLQNKVMQGFTHALKALKLIKRGVSCHFKNGRDSVGVMGGKLRINPVGHA